MDRTEHKYAALGSFTAALQLLTVFRIQGDPDCNPRAVALSMAWFPLVGFILGVVLSLTWFLMNAFFPPVFTSVLLVSLLALMTRGLHLDGLSDTLDGLGGGYSREKRLKIMKDSHIGAFGVIGIVLVLLFKFVLIWQMPDRIKIGALLVFPVQSRFSMVIMAWLSSYARSEGGLGENYVNLVGSREVLIALIVSLAVGVIFLGRWGLLLTVVVIFLGIAFSVFFQRILGGVTGDILGAVNEICEIVVLALCLVLPFS